MRAWVRRRRFWSRRKRRFTPCAKASGESLEPISLVLHKVFDRLTELAQSDSDIPGLSTGLIDLDRRINGLNRSDLLLIAARPAME
ncbi:MAG: DnaB-like helicase C-terminal domain-containing protein [Oscillospiraceae bacterium]